MALAGKLTVPNRFITTHNEKGEAIIDASVPSTLPFYELPSGIAAFSQAYVTDTIPAQIGGDKDVAAYQKYLKSPPGLTVSTGTVLRYVDMPPGSTSAMHRTVSVDYGVVLEGDIELILDSGETRVMKRGDICVQRGTMHAWRNRSETEWGRMLYVLQPVQPFTIAGEPAKELLGGMPGVKESS